MVGWAKASRPTIETTLGQVQQPLGVAIHDPPLEPRSASCHLTSQLDKQAFCEARDCNASSLLSVWQKSMATGTRTTSP